MDICSYISYSFLSCLFFIHVHHTYITYMHLLISDSSYILTYIHVILVHTYTHKQSNCYIRNNIQLDSIRTKADLLRTSSLALTSWKVDKGKNMENI
jgi:hypothetical protein